jgi:hypothetical protein
MTHAATHHHNITITRTVERHRSHGRRRRSIISGDGLPVLLPSPLEAGQECGSVNTLARSCGDVNGQRAGRRDSSPKKNGNVFVAVVAVIYR